mgnify:CR=1 FL=1
MANRRMIAFCGLDCAACQCYQATMAGDPDSMERARQYVANTFNAPDVTIRDVTCEGCTAPEERRATYCAMCEIRACATKRGVPTCGHCPDYACATLAPTLAYSPEARANLEAIRASL